MPVTLLALFRRPEGGQQALETFHQRYVDEHVPLMERVPGLTSMTVHHVTHAYSETDLVLVTEMTFDDRSSLDAAMGSPEMREAGRNIRDIAPGLMTLVVLEPAPAADRPEGA